MTTARIGPLAGETVVESCSSAYPLEACGLLIGARDGSTVTVTRALRCANVAPPEERASRFSIDPRVVINVTRSLRGKQESIVGFFHSHPDSAPEPSTTDLEYIRLWPESLWLIVPVLAGSCAEPRGWWLDVDGSGIPRELEVVQSAPSNLAAACPE